MVAVDGIQANLQARAAKLNGIRIGSTEVGSVDFDASTKQVIARTLKLSSVNVDTIQLNGWGPAAGNYIALNRLDVSGIHVSPSARTAPVTTICQQLPSSADLGGDAMAPLRPLLPLLLKDIEILHGDLLTIALAAAIAILILKLLSILWLWRSLLMFLLPLFTAAAPLALYFLLRDVLVAAIILAALAILFRIFVYRRGERWYQRWEPFVVDLASVVVLLPLLGYGIALPPFPEPPAGLQLDRIEVANIEGRPTDTAQFDIPKTTIEGLRIALPGTDPKLEVGVASIEIPKTNIRIAPSSRVTLDRLMVDNVNVAYNPSRREVGDFGAHLRLAGLFESDALAKELRNIEFLRGIPMRSRVGFDADVSASGPEGPSKVSTQFPRSKNLVAVNAAVTLKPVECTANFDVAARIQTEPLMMTARADGDTESVQIRSLRSMPGSPIQIAGGRGSVKWSGAPELSLNLDSIGGTFGSTPLNIASVGITASAPRPGRAGIQSATIAVGPTSIQTAGWDVRVANSNVHMDRMLDKRSVPMTFETRIDNVQVESADRKVDANFPSFVARVTGQASPETIPRLFNGTVDFTAFGSNASDELVGTSRPISFDANLWAGLFNIPEQEIRIHESLLSEVQAELPVRFRLAGRLSAIAPHPNADIEARAVLGQFEQDLGSARLALDNAVVSGRANWDDQGASANLNYGIESTRIALSAGPSALCLNEISTLDVSASGTLSRMPESSGFPSLVSAPSVCATLPHLPESMNFRISGSVPVGPETPLVRLERENGTGIRIPEIVNEIRSLQIRDGRLVRMETRVNILGVGTLQGGRSIDVQADLLQAKDSIQISTGVLAPDGTRMLDVAIDSTPARLSLDATQHVAADRIIAQIQPFLSDLQVDLGNVNPQARLTQLHADVNFENGELLNAAAVARLARGALISFESPALRANVATSPSGVEPSVSLNIGRATGPSGLRRIVAAANIPGANVRAVTDKDVVITADADIGVIAQATLFGSGQPPSSPVLDRVFQVGSGLGRQASQLASLLDAELDAELDADATASPIQNLQWKVRLLQNSPQAPLLQLAPDSLQIRVATAAVDAAWDSAISQDRSRISLSTALDSDIRLDREDVLLDVLTPLAATFALDGQPETRIDSNIPIQAVFSERLSPASANAGSLWNPEYYAQFWRAHPSRLSGAAFATPIDFNELVLGPVSLREVRFPLEPLRIAVGYADALQVGLPLSGRVLYGEVLGNLETSMTASSGVATIETRLNLDLNNFQAGAIGSTSGGGHSSFVEDELNGKISFRTDGLTIDPATLSALRAGHVRQSELEKLGVSVHLSRSRESENPPGVFQASSEVQINLVNELLNQIVSKLRLPAPPRALTYKELALNFDVDRGQVRTDSEVFKLGGVELFSSTVVDATAEVRAHLGRPGERIMLGNLIEMLGSFGSAVESGGR